MTLSSNDSVAKYIAASGQAAWNVPNLSPQTPLRAIKKVGSIGAGALGGGISLKCAPAGIAV
ncbi:MAG: 3-hydroxyacyl-CoA dehydrogenase, partial [Paracoccaceae bacterium]